MFLILPRLWNLVPRAWLMTSLLEFAVLLWVMVMLSCLCLAATSEYSPYLVWLQTHPHEAAAWVGWVWWPWSNSDPSCLPYAEIMNICSATMVDWNWNFQDCKWREIVNTSICLKLQFLNVFCFELCLNEPIMFSFIKSYKYFKTLYNSLIFHKVHGIVFILHQNDHCLSSCRLNLAQEFPTSIPTCLSCLLSVYFVPCDLALKLCWVLCPPQICQALSQASRLWSPFWCAFTSLYLEITDSVSRTLVNLHFSVKPFLSLTGEQVPPVPSETVWTWAIKTLPLTSCLMFVKAPNLCKSQLLYMWRGLITVSASHHRHKTERRSIRH